MMGNTGLTHVGEPSQAKSRGKMKRVRCFYQGGVNNQAIAGNKMTRSRDKQEE